MAADKPDTPTYMRHGDLIHRMALELARGRRSDDEVGSALGDIAVDTLLALATAVMFVARMNTNPIGVVDAMIELLERNKSTEAFNRFSTGGGIKIGDSNDN